MFVKVCGLSDIRHVDAAVDAGADAVGFVFYPPSVRNVSAAEARAASSNVPQNIRRVAVMMHPEADECARVLEQFQPDVLQTDAADFDYLDIPDGVERWPVCREGGEVVRVSATFLYEGLQSGQGETVDWKTAAGFAQQGNMILAGGLDATNVGDAIRRVQPFGVDVSSGVESAPGQKDARLITEFIKAAKAAGQHL